MTMIRRLLAWSAAAWLFAVTSAAAQDLYPVDDLGVVLPSAAGSSLAIVQNGSFQGIDVLQTGTNSAEISQVGVGQVIALEQVGMLNRASLEQTGVDNRAAVSQLGSLNEAALIQAGNANFAEIRQVGIGLSATVTQLGDNNTATVVQEQ